MFAILREISYGEVDPSAWDPLRHAVLIDEVSGVALTIIGGVGFYYDWPSSAVSSNILALGLSNLILSVVRTCVTIRHDLERQQKFF